MSEKLCLKWNDFQENTNSAFGRLREDNDFTDITLACEDGKQVEAHKVILVASSPFFQNLLKRNKHSHPLIYMRGVKSEDLVAIVDFIYYGEANVYQEKIDSFLAIAQELSLKGLTGSPDGKSASVQEHLEKPTTTKLKVEAFETTECATGADSSYGTIATTTPVFSGELLELDEHIKSMMTKSQNMITYGNRSERASICTVCGKEGHPRNIKDHIEANHIEGISIPCTSCDKTFRSRHSLRNHKSRCQ